MSGKPRVPLLAEHDDVPREHQHYLDRVVLTRGWVSGVFQVLMHTPDVATRVANIGDFVLYHSVLPRATQTLCWLIAAREFDCNYAWDASVGHARAAKLDPKLIDALEHGRPVAAFAREHKVLFDFCRQLLRGNHHVAEDSYQAAVKQYGVSGTVQISITVGYFAMMALVANAFNVPPVGDDSKTAL